MVPWRAYSGERLKQDTRHVWESRTFTPIFALEDATGSTDAAAVSLWMESLLWASECFNRSATAANDGWLSLHKIFYGSRLPLPLLSFFQPVYHRVPRQRKSDPRIRLCYFRNFGYNHGHDCHKLLDAGTGKVSRDSCGTIQRHL